MSEKNLLPFAYRLSKAKGGSDVYGKCECCGKAADTVYLLTQMRRFEQADGQQSLTMTGCFQKFGHKNCLAELT